MIMGNPDRKWQCTMTVRPADLGTPPRIRGRSDTFGAPRCQIWLLMMYATAGRVYRPTHRPSDVSRHAEGRTRMANGQDAR
jgi:hypothetical protein